MVAFHTEDALLMDVDGPRFDGVPGKRWALAGRRGGIIFVSVTMAIAGLAAWPHAGFSKAAIRKSGGIIGKSSEEGKGGLPDDHNHKESHNGVAIITNDRLGDGKDKDTFTIVMKDGFDVDDVEAAVKEIPDNLKLEFVSRHKDVIVINGLLKDIESFVDDHLKGVGYIEEDTDTALIQEQPADKKDAYDDQVPGSRRLTNVWGIDRSDQQLLPLNQKFNPIGDGKGVHVYVLDTGVRTTHVDFGGRAIPTLEVLGRGTVECDASDDACANDFHGHGTHCAGTIGGITYGVAPKSIIHSVAVLGPNGGMLSWFTSAVNWVADKGQKPSVISASLGGKGQSQADKVVITDAVEDGVIVVVAAGNENDNACEYSPSFVPAAITVGATTRHDDRAEYSNFGSCVDIFAPGSNIISAGMPPDMDEDNSKNKDESATMSGTSMACPHVAGAAAVLLGNGVKPNKVWNKLKGRSSVNLVHDAKEKPNHFLYLGKKSDDGSPSTTPEPESHGHCKSQGWEVTKGSCKIDSDCCLTSPGYPQEYENDGHCEIKVGADPGPITVEKFNIESGWDFLAMQSKEGQGGRWTGSTGPGGITPSGTITFTSDIIITAPGFKLCLNSYGEPQSETMETFDGKDYRPDTKCVKDFTWDGETMTKKGARCTKKYHHVPWCSLLDKFDGWQWAECKPV